jgi:outer membrane protein
MKLRNIAAAVLITLFSFTANAQAPKIGYTSVEYIITQVPESKQIQADLEAYGKQLENQLQSKQKMLQEKYEAYQKGAATMADAIRADKEREIRDLQQQLVDFQKDAEESLLKKENQLLEPLLEKIEKAINEVAKEEEYTYIINSDAGRNATVLLYKKEEFNITDKVLKKVVESNQKAAPTPAPKPASTTPATKQPAGKK